MTTKRFFACMVALAATFTLYAASPDGLVPAPVEYQLGKAFNLKPKVVEIKPTNYFLNRISSLPDFAKEEAYLLRIGRRRITIQAAGELGALRAKQTLEQLRLLGGKLACCTIFDYPRFAHRGLMIDESRSFKGKDFLKKQMDAMALLKLNVLHLHLTDAAGWRIEVPEYPELTNKAAWRTGRTYAEWEAAGYPFSSAADKEAYGGFYTADDLREIVACASERGITVIPEIEMPGHSMEVNRCYPEFACVDSTGRHRNFAWDLCPGNEGTFGLLKAVLDEVMDIFPGKYIHIGGDEAVMKDWPVCVNCRRRMEEEGFTQVRELQGYLVRRIEEYLRTHGRTAIGWDEVLETGVPQSAVVQSWRGIEGGKKAAGAGHDVVMSPSQYCYFNYYQDLIRKERPAVGTLTSLHVVYGYNPTEGMTDEEASHVLGLQANLWCELIYTYEHAEYMLYPRLFALAERGWSPYRTDGWDAFRKRARGLVDVLHALGYDSFDMDTETLRAQSPDPYGPEWN